MVIYSETITLQTAVVRECISITAQVKGALEKSGFHDGIIVVTALHSNCGVIVSDEEPGLIEDIEQWITKLAPTGSQYKHNDPKFESNAGIHLQSLLLHHQVIVPFTNARVDLGPGQFVIFVELDGLRPKRVSLKVIGE
jgi:secondary thiamine-phosphate synthase enzyme